MRMKKNNIVSLILMLALVLCISVGATLAFLTNQSNAVSNTFTLASTTDGKLDLSLTEEVRTRDKDMVDKEHKVRIPGYDGLEIHPGGTLMKNPILKSEATSTVPCYMYVKVNISGMTLAEFEDIFAGRYMGKNDKGEEIAPKAAQFFRTEITSPWKVFADDVAPNDPNTLYYYYDAATTRKPGEEQNGPLERSFQIKDTLTDAQKTALANTTITFTAYAIEAEGSKGALVTWQEAKTAGDLVL